MKIRTGFVSNSSSSSFIIGCNEELSLEFLTKHLKPNGHPLAWLIEGLAKFIIQHAEAVTVPPKKDETWDNHVSDVARKLSERFKFIYSFAAANDDGDSLSYILYDNADKFMIQTKELVIKGEYE